MSNKVLITGSAGFIFSNFIRQSFHTKQDYNIVSIDKVRKSHVLHNIYVNKNHEFYIGNVTDEHLVNVVFEAQRPQIVIHAAAETAVDSSITDAQLFIKSNVLGTQVIIDACLKWGVKKLVYISTDEVYGHLDSENQPSFTENSPISPRNPYAASKAAGELLVKAAHQTHGLQYVITRSANNYGPWQTQEKLIPKIIKNILNQTKVPIYGSGMQIRDWIHVSDNCNALFKIINDGEANTEYNISSSQELANIEVFQRVCNALGKGHDLLEFVQDRPGHDFRYSIDNSKLKSLGWKPEYKFNDGLIPTLQWYLNNQWIFKLG